MKKNISVILIACFLMQLSGCYYQREVTFKELTSKKDDDIIIIANDSVKYILKENITTGEIVLNPENNYCIGADTSLENLILYKYSLLKKNEQKISIVTDTVFIKKIDVNGIYVSEINPTVRMIVIVGVIIVVIAGVLVMRNNYNPFN